MFSALIQKAQATVDNLVEQALGRVVMAIPFLIAAGFATAALTIWLIRTFGAEIGNLILAIVFCVIGVVTAAAVKARTADRAKLQPDRTDALADPESTPNRKQMSEADRELLTTALSVMTPVALPGLLRLMLRNLPLLAVLGVAAFIFSRARSSGSPFTGDGAAESAPHAQPAE